jgi:Lon protease-like protein
MTPSAFDPAFEDLPSVLPVFPLTGALLLPGGRLPLNIFEPRYLAMIRDGLAGDRLIGMVQPRDGMVRSHEDRREPGSAALYHTGCAGRIVSFSETDDGRYLITLAGLIRFAMVRELALHNGYRRVVPDFGAYRGDLGDDRGQIDRARLLDALKAYFTASSLDGDWDTIEAAQDEQLVTSLAMACPFAASEKQALLEAKDLAERAETMTAILELAALESDPERAAARH